MYYESHDFYCIKCGRKGIPIMRGSAKKKEKFHRKRLYCPWCKEEVNHIECRNPQEADKFKEDFMNGVYVDEANQSVAFINEYKY